MLRRRSLSVRSNAVSGITRLQGARCSTRNCGNADLGGRLCGRRSQRGSRAVIGATGAATVSP
eukprot:7568626-Pyramimonas_sp.AAC.1